MTFVDQQKPSLGDVIEHHGVKGQKWGVHKGKPTSSDIKDARLRSNVTRGKIAVQKTKVKAATGDQKVKEEKKLGKLKADFLKDPDTATSLRLTRGEKAGAVVLAVAVPGGVIGVAGGLAYRRSVRKGIERRQALGITG